MRPSLARFCTHMMAVAPLVGRNDENGPTFGRWIPAKASIEAARKRFPRGGETYVKSSAFLIMDCPESITEQHALMHLAECPCRMPVAFPKGSVANDLLEAEPITDQTQGGNVDHWEVYV